MPKNSRPDIQVLEDRIVRLKAQLTEYKDLRLYGATKRRLSRVSSELEECISIINGIVNTNSNNISSSSLSAYDEYPGAGLNEFDNTGDDLLDTFLLSPNKDPNPEDFGPSAREIVKTYRSRLSECAAAVTGIIQVNQFCQLLNSWYQNRFTPATKNPNFFFKANRIHEWIDLLMIAAGHALHEGMFPAFVSDMNAWIADLNTSNDLAWVLPYSVMRMKNVDASCCTKEAVLLEIIVKHLIYDKSFYFDEKHSVARIVISNSGLSESDLTLDSIIRSCPKLIITSSFDKSQYEITTEYQEEADG